MQAIGNIYTNCTYAIHPIVAKVTIMDVTPSSFEMPFRTIAQAKKWLEQFNIAGLWIDGVGQK